MLLKLLTGRAQPVLQPAGAHSGSVEAKKHSEGRSRELCCYLAVATFYWQGSRRLLEQLCFVSSLVSQMCETNK